MKHDWTTDEAWGRIGAALLGSTALYLAFCLVLATSLPLTQDVGRLVASTRQNAR